MNRWLRNPRHIEDEEADAGQDVEDAFLEVVGVAVSDAEGGDAVELEFGAEAGVEPAADGVSNPPPAPPTKIVAVVAPATG